MTAAELARLCDGRRVKPGQWMGRCPNRIAHAHGDRNRSLSLREGEGGCVLVNCFTGCDTEEVLRALGLTWADLYPDKQLTPQQWTAIARERERREAWALERKQRERKLTEDLCRWETLRDSLGIKLAAQPEGNAGDELARLFHQALDRVRAMEEQLDTLKKQKGSPAGSL
jgi:hypothetical protein